MSEPESCYGCVGEFEDGEALLRAVHAARLQGYEELEAYSPLPVEGLTEALEFAPVQIPALVLLGGVVSAFAIFFIEFYSAMIDYPFNIGGRPYNSWPAFLFVGLEVTMMGAAVWGVAGILWLSRLPALHHPIFDARRFERASRDGFFLCIRGKDRAFDAGQVEGFLQAAGALTVEALPS